MDKSEETLSLQQPAYATLFYNDIVELERHLVRLANLAFSESKQRKAYIETMRRILWFDWVTNLDRTDKSVPVGMPIPGIDAPFADLE